MAGSRMRFFGRKVRPAAIHSGRRARKCPSAITPTAWYSGTVKSAGRVARLPAHPTESPITVSTPLRLFRTYLLPLLIANIAAAQEAPPSAVVPEVTSTAELTAVWVGGNSEASTFGAAAGVRFGWPKSELKLDAGGIRTESELTTRRAIGTESGFEIVETSDRQRTAENYFARARFDRNLNQRFLVFAGVDWLRNTFSGINSRILVAAGGGNTWTDTETTRFKTDYGFTYTFQNDVIENPFTSANFPGIRAAYDLWRRISATTEVTSGFVADMNLKNTNDVRLNFVAALPVAISAKLALKPSLQLLWQNEPSLAEVALFSSPAPGSDLTGTVLVPLQKLDTFFTLAIVVNL